MKKAITIFALILMIFAVSCSNDTPAPANEVPEKADLSVATPAVPETAADDAVFAQFLPIITAMQDPYIEAVSDNWTNWYNSDEEKIFTQVDGKMYVTVDGAVLRAGDSVDYDPLTPNSIKVNDVEYTSASAQGRKYIEDVNDLVGTMVKNVESIDVEKIFSFSEEITAEGQTEPTTVTYTITVTGGKTTTTDELAEPGLNVLEANEISIVVSPEYGGVTTAKLNVYDVIETDEATDLVPDPQPYKDTKYVLTVGDASYSIPEGTGRDQINAVLNAIFN